MGNDGSFLGSCKRFSFLRACFAFIDFRNGHLVQFESGVKKPQLKIAYYAIRLQLVEVLFCLFIVSLVSFPTQVVQILPLSNVNEKAQEAPNHFFLVKIFIFISTDTQVVVQFTFQACSLVTECAVAEVFDGIVRATQETHSNHRPSIVHSDAHDVDDPDLFTAPGRLAEQRAQIVDPSLATLLPFATGNVFSNDMPLSRPKPRDLFYQKLV